MSEIMLAPVSIFTLPSVPAIFVDAGQSAGERFFEFFAATIRNPNTRRAYLQAALRFGGWCDVRGIALNALRPLHVAAYVEELGKELAPPSVKLHFSAIRQLLDYLVAGNLLPFNAATPVRGPRYVVKQGKTPILTAAEAKSLFASIDTDTLIGKRDRALTSVLLYSFSRIGAALAMNVEDFATEGRRAILRLHEKGGKSHHVPAHHLIEFALDDFVQAAGIADEKSTPLFRTFDSKRQLTETRLQPREALAMIKRRAMAAGLGDSIGCHSLRASGITVYMANGGQLETAAAIAAHESPRTTKLYDRSGPGLSLNEIERIRL